MGALTLKSFPLEFRRWDIKSHESIDPTDSFGQSTNVYIDNDRILKIEPNYSNYSMNSWLTDKGRHFFDCFFETITPRDNDSSYFIPWKNLFKTIHNHLYQLNMCNCKNSNKQFIIVIFEYLSIESLNILYILMKAYPFLFLKRAETFRINNNLEHNFQINSSVWNKNQLFSSTLCLLLGVNTRYENAHLNLKLRQRNLKGNFEFWAIGSLFNFTFPVLFLGSNISVLKTILEGNNRICQHFKFFENPLLIYNSEILKRTDAKNLLNLTKTLEFAHFISKTWNGLNMLNHNITEVGINSLNLFSTLSIKDLLYFNSLYIINITMLDIKNLKKLTESKLFNFVTVKKNYEKNILIDQGSNKFNISLLNSSMSNFKHYIYLPSSTFFESNETFFSTEGFVKRTTKLIFKKKSKNNWQLIRRVLKTLKFKNSGNKNLSFRNNESHTSKHFINVQFYATYSLTDLSYYLNVRNNPFFILKSFLLFKKISVKMFSTKIKYWLDDFFSGGKDNYCHKSLTLINCSLNIRLNSTNFF